MCEDIVPEGGAGSPLVCSTNRATREEIEEDGEINGALVGLRYSPSLRDVAMSMLANDGQRAPVVVVRNADTFGEKNVTSYSTSRLKNCGNRRREFFQKGQPCQVQL